MPKEIPLTQGKVAIVDDQDFERVNQFKWYARVQNNKGLYRTEKWYASRRDQFGGTVYMHRFIKNCPKGKVVDHRNSDGLDNRRCNLQITTQSKNAGMKTASQVNYLKKMLALQDAIAQQYWDNLKGGLQMTEAVSQEEWLNSTKTRELTLSEMDALIKENQELWADYEKKKKISSDARVLAEDSDAKVIRLLKEAGKKSYKLDGLGTISIASRESVKVPASIEDKQHFFNYLKETAGDEVMWSYISVNSQSLNSWFKEKLAQLPKDQWLGFKVPGLGEMTAKEYLNFRKEKA